MKAPDRDLRLLKHIVSYCEQIHMAVERFGADYSIFAADPVYRNAVSLCILQIGELVSNLSDAFRQEHPAIPWRQIKLMRKQYWGRRIKERVFEELPSRLNP